MALSSVSSNLTAFFILLFAFLIYKISTLGTEIPNDLPWVGQDHNGPFKRTRSYLRSVLGTREMLREGYEKVPNPQYYGALTETNKKQYSKCNQAFILPNLFTGAEILLPPSKIDWLNNQPETKFSILETHRQFIRADYTMLLDQTTMYERIFRDAFRKNLTRRFDELLSTLAEEVEYALDNEAGFDNEQWMAIDGFKFWKKVVVRVVSSIYVGRPLCRNQSYLYYASKFNQHVMMKAGIIGTLPVFLRPIVGYLLVLPDKFRHMRCASITAPTIQKRLHQEAEALSGKTEELGPRPNDLLTWACADAARAAQSGNPAKFSVDFLTRRLSLMNFTSTHSTALNLNSLLLDLLFAARDHAASGAPGPDLLQRVQSEVDAAYRQYCQTRRENPTASAAAAAGQRFLDALPTLDACFKETLRLRGFVSRIAAKTATRAGSETIVPGVGAVPAGVKVGVPVWGVHHDAAVYADPFEWRAERWLDEGGGGGGGGPMQGVPVTGGGSRAMFRSYMPFGYKNTAWFFAVNVIKLIAAHTLLHYDIELPPAAAGGGGEEQRRPEHRWWGTSISYGTESTYLIRRRRDSAASPSTDGAGSWWHVDA